MISQFPERKFQQNTPEELIPFVIPGQTVQKGAALLYDGMFIQYSPTSLEIIRIDIISKGKGHKKRFYFEIEIEPTILKKNHCNKLYLPGGLQLVLNSLSYGTLSTNPNGIIEPYKSINYCGFKFSTISKFSYDIILNLRNIFLTEEFRSGAGSFPDIPMLSYVLDDNKYSILSTELLGKKADLNEQGSILKNCKTKSEISELVSEIEELGQY